MDTQTRQRLSLPNQSLFHDLMLHEDNDHEVSALADNTYYRSRLFTACPGINLLITSAQPLLVLISRLINSPRLNELQTLQKLLPHELKAFVGRAQGFGYTEQQLSIAQYLISTALNEIIEQFTVKEATDNTSTTLQTEPSDTFFTVLNRLRLHADTYVDLIELGYLIICVGYSGSYRFLTNGKDEIENLLESLYQVILEQRGDNQPSLLAANLVTPTQKKMKTSIHLGWLTAMVMTILLSFGMGFSYVLNSISHSLLMQIK